MIHLVLPIGSSYGWGIVGKYIARELAKRGPIRLITQPLPGDLEPLERRLFESTATIIPQDQHPSLQVDGPVLQIVGPDFSSFAAEVRGTRRVAHTVYETDSVPPAAREKARQFDHVAAGSTWYGEVLRSAGLTNVSVVLQGIDPLLFNPTNSEKEFFPDIFTVFSGGKLEYRKGQDLVIRAFKVLQDRHKDVLLVTAWFNQWPATMNSMAVSPHIRFPNVTGTYDAVIRQLLGANGIDLSRTLILGAMHHALMPRVYKDTDVGLFPNRCEGGTNLVLMEYMGCGKPAIASHNTGQADVIADGHSIPIRKMHRVPATLNNQATTFFEPDVEETIEHLEWAYQNRDKLREVGTRAGEVMQKFTWRHTADAFQKLLEPGPAR